MICSKCEKDVLGGDEHDDCSATPQEGLVTISLSMKHQSASVVRGGKTVSIPVEDALALIK